MRMSRIVLVSLAVLVLCFGGTSVFGAETFTFQLAHEMSAGHPYDLGAHKFDELLREKTGGRAKVEVFPSGQLGTQRDSAEACAMGGLDFAMTMTSILESYDPRFEAISLPFIFRDWDHVFKVVDGEIGAKLNSFIEPKGIVIPAYFLNGDLHVASRIPIKGPADMKGIKLRCQQAKTMLEFGKALGTVVTPMPYGEVFTALQLGTIDAQVQNYSNLLYDKHYEVVDYINEAAPFYYLEPLLMSREVMEGLPADIRDAVFEAAKEAADWQRQLYLDNRDNMFIPELKKNGVTFIASSNEEWKEALEAAGYYEVFDVHKELIDEIIATK